MSDEISKALNLPPLNDKVEVLDRGPTVEDDFEYARGNMLNIIEKGNEALDGILQVAGMSQHPRSYEVAANLIKTMAETNKDLLELTKKKKEILKDEAKPTTVHNNLFVGSTAELQKLIKQQNGTE
jgi:hypothetical protein